MKAKPNKEQIEILEHNWNSKRERFIKETFTPRIYDVLEKIPELKINTEVKNSFIFGTVGCGKTIYACQLMLLHYKKRYFDPLWVNSIKIEKKPLRYIFINVEDLFAELKESYDKSSNKTEASIINPILNADVLILDDIAIEETTNWIYATLYRIVNYRYEQKKLTIITSNPSMDELAKSKTLDFRILRRIAEMCENIKKKSYKE